MSIKNLIVVVVTSIGMTACGASNPYYSHETHGKVEDTSPIYLADRAECDKEAFGDGFNAGGKSINSVDEAVSYISDHYLKQIYSGKKTSEWEPLDKKVELEVLTKESNNCIKKKGWEYHSKNS